MYSLIQWDVFWFCWWFPSLCRNFLVWWSLTCLFLFLFPLLEGNMRKNITQTDRNSLLPIVVANSLLPMLSSRRCMVSGLIFKSLNPFWVYFCLCVKRWSRFICMHASVLSFVCMHLSSIPKTTCWRNCCYSFILVYTMEYYTAIKKDEILPFLKTWMI